MVNIPDHIGGILFIILGNFMEFLENEGFLIKELPHGSYRSCTKEEINLALAAESKRKALMGLIDKAQAKLMDITINCKHPVVYDEIGIVHDSRRCLYCGSII